MSFIGKLTTVGLTLFVFSAGAQTCVTQSSGIAGLAQSVNSIAQEVGTESAGNIDASSCRKTLITRAPMSGGAATTNEVTVFPAEIRMGDAIACEGDGKIEITFKNETKLTIMSNSSLLIEDYLRDRQSNVGKLVLSRLHGSLKMLVNHDKGPQDVNIRTFAVGIGVRGTTFEVHQSFKNGVEEVVVKTIEGRVAVKNRLTGEEQFVTAGSQLVSSDKTMILTRPSPSK